MSDASAALAMKDCETKARIADAEKKALSTIRFRDLEGAMSSKMVANKMRRDEILGIALLACAVMFFVVLFVVL